MKTTLTSGTILGIAFLSQFVVGFIGNTYLLVLNINTFLFQSHKKKPRDFIFTHLTLVNFMTIAFIGIPEILSSFGIRNFLDDKGCRAVLYMYRVNRSLSLCTTTFLSTFQACIITPNNSWWACLKPRISANIFPPILFFWILNMLIYSCIIINALAPDNTTAAGQIFSLTYCAGRQGDTLPNAVFLGAMMARDFLCVFLMIWTTAYMVRLLVTHRKSVQYIHRTSPCLGPSPEIKATHTILALVICFVFFYSTNSCLTIYTSYRHDVNKLENITVFLSFCYPAICPFLLINNHNRHIFLKCTSHIQRCYNGTAK
uniref:Vomeronasal type-1 receptor n=1 Tax=Catagonus wagneri TaxID=51154 RepID=A0A8C3WEU4_9CETA